MINPLEISANGRYLVDQNKPAIPHMCLHISGEPPNASRMAARGVAMGEEEAASADLERLCQGISPGVAACTYPATVRCTSCQKWFCDAHAEDEQWHACMVSNQ